MAKYIDTKEPLAPNATVDLQMRVNLALKNFPGKTVNDLLYFYGDFNTIQIVGNSDKLKVSSGMTTQQLTNLGFNYTGQFPVGIYGTDIAPWSDENTVCSQAMRQAFYGTTYAQAKDLSYFYAFIKDAQWSAAGSLTFNSTTGIAHWCKPGGTQNDLIAVQGVCYGKGLISNLPFRYIW
jgi:hypothetical protein